MVARREGETNRLSGHCRCKPFRTPEPSWNHPGGETKRMYKRKEEQENKRPVEGETRYNIRQDSNTSLNRNWATSQHPPVGNANKMEKP